MVQPYHAIPRRSTLRAYLLEVTKTVQEESWLPYYNFMALPISNFVLRYDPLFAKLEEYYKFHAGIIKLPPNTCYDWHVDTDRSVSINMLVNDNTDSHCLFRAGEGEVSFPVTRLVYSPDTYYIFNTKVPHTVLNFSPPRYMFSVEFIGADRGLTFDALCSTLLG